MNMTSIPNTVYNENHKNPQYQRTNRGIQRDYSTYSNTDEVAEAINRLKPLLSPKAIDLLRYFLPTKGATQAKVKTLCQKTEMCLATFYEVQNELETILDEPIIFTVKAPPKKDKLGRPNKSSEYKILQPLWKIKMLVHKKRRELEQEHAEFMAQFAPPEPQPESRPESRQSGSNPTESKDEQPPADQQYNSFRENLLDIKNNRLRKNDSSNKKAKKFGIKKEIKQCLRTSPLFNAFDDIKKHEIEKRVQLAFIRTGARMDNDMAQAAAKEALKRFVNDCEKGGNVNKDYYGALFTYVENALLDHFNEWEEDMGLAYVKQYREIRPNMGFHKWLEIQVEAGRDMWLEEKNKKEQHQLTGQYKDFNFDW